MSRLLAFLQTTVADFSSGWGAPKREDAPVVKKEDAPTIGKYKVDYSEPTQAQVDAANAECADLFKSGKWISVNRKS
jgi:hypothetical protein